MKACFWIPPVKTMVLCPTLMKRGSHYISAWIILP
uniref:Uncharacterized protein n=1 Tax=Anguilla anguilla TaxID=7936 RepID=A0A0E9PX51_ANGAN